MKFLIKHDIKGRIRVQMCQTRMSFSQADMLQYYLEGREYIHAVKIQVRTQGVVIQYEESARAQVIDDLRAFGYDRVTVPESYLYSDCNCEISKIYLAGCSYTCKR